MAKYHLVTDVLTLIGVYFLLGGTLTALFAASICGLIVSALLHIVNNKKDFLYLYDLREAVMDKVRSAQKSLNDYGKSYRESHKPFPKEINFGTE